MEEFERNGGQLPDDDGGGDPRNARGQSRSPSPAGRR